MIKPNELRIGNYIQTFDNNSNMIWIIDTIGSKAVTLRYPGRCIESRKFYRIEPIPITSERLLKFGFEKKYLVYRKSELTYNEVMESWWFSFEPLKKQIKFVHELQNLYYALTGEELTIQE